MLKTRLHARFGVNCQQKIKQDRIAAKDAYFVRVISLVRLHDLHSKGSLRDKGLKNAKVWIPMFITSNYQKEVFASLLVQ